MIPNIILLDIDGCLTDNKVFISSTGEKFKSFHSRDNRAIAELISHGYEVHLLTASSWEGSKSYARNLKVDLHVDREKDYLKITKGKAFIGVGDDLWDKEFLTAAQWKFCPADAVNSIKEIPGMHVMETKGGGGLVVELVGLLLQRVGSYG